MAEFVSTSVRDLMKSSGVAFGTSGARGLASAMTDWVCYGYTAGFLQYLREIGQFAANAEIALAGDLRPSTPRILQACVQAIRDAGGRAVFCGYVPTPALAHYAFSRRIPSIMVTGSHIPEDRNGIKFYLSAGEILKQDEAGVSRQILSMDKQLFTGDDLLKNPQPLPEICNTEDVYLRRYLDFFGPGALRGLTIGLYEHSAVGRDLFGRILRALGAEVLPLGRSDVFVPVDTEALRPEDIELAHQWAKEHRLHAIVSTDGDSDRPLLADHQGNWLRGDILGLLCARELKAGCVVTPVSSNTALERCGAFPQVVRTRIGSPYVIAAMNEAAQNGCTSVCGYEANGGFLLGGALSRGERQLTPLPTRDAVLPILTVLETLKSRPLADLRAELPSRVTWSDRLKNFPTEDSRAILNYLLAGSEPEAAARIETHFRQIAGSLLQIDQTDGLRMIFESGAVIHLRPSGNAPELRCYTEADVAEAAQNLNAKTIKLIQSELLSATRNQP